MNRLVALGLYCVCIAVPGWAQLPARIAELQRQQDEGVAAPFKGVTTNANAVSGLFQIEPTGFSTQPVLIAADAFLAGLSDDQRARTLFPIDDSEWRRWDNRPRVPRQGVGFNEMSAQQRELAYDLMRASLSAKGLETSANIMKLNETLAEMRNDWETFGQWKYWISVMGVPSGTEPWGWQLDGHHLTINYFVVGDQVVMTPSFFGSQPVRAESGKFEGIVVLQDEQDRGLQLLSALSEAQKDEAILGEKSGNVFFAGAYRDNAVLDYAGISASRLSGEQRSLLLELIAEYVGNLRDSHARVRMGEVSEHFDSTYFAWIGGTDPDAAFYYRVHSPVILIEFDHVGSGAAGRRDHIHSIVRTPNGNDYGKDLLRQHYEAHPHPAN